MCYCVCKMSFWGYTVLAVFCAYAISSGEAIKCFECTSDGDHNCGDPFYYGHMPLIDCDRKNQYQPQSQTYTGSNSVCKKTKRYVNGHYIVERSCALMEPYGIDPCGGNNNNNYGYRDSNSAYQSSYPNNYGGGSNYGNNYGSSQNYGSNYGNNNYGGNNYNSRSYGGYDQCTVCRYDACNSATSFEPTLWGILVSTMAIITVKCL